MIGAPDAGLRVGHASKSSERKIARRCFWTQARPHREFNIGISSARLDIDEILS
jgi:hypothetical protein